jgi:hypothetical protein
MSKFTYVCVLYPGGTGDSRAYQSSELCFYIDSLPPNGFYGIVDNMCTLSEHITVE